MTPEEIRAIHNGEAYQGMTADRETYWAFRDSSEFLVLREIAAQLAEHAEIAKKMLAVYERAWPEKTP